MVSPRLCSQSKRMRALEQQVLMSLSEIFWVPFFIFFFFFWCQSCPFFHLQSFPPQSQCLFLYRMSTFRDRRVTVWLVPLPLFSGFMEWQRVLKAFFRWSRETFMVHTPFPVSPSLSGNLHFPCSWNPFLQSAFFFVPTPWGI